MNRDTTRTEHVVAGLPVLAARMNRCILLASAACISTLAFVPMTADATTTLPNATGVAVAQVEANVQGGATTNDQFEAASSTIPLTYMDFNGYISSTAGYSYSISSGTTSTTYTDSISSHANTVAGYFYGSGSYATGVSSVDNIDAGVFQGYFLGITGATTTAPAFNVQHTSYVSPTANGSQTIDLANVKVVNQSYTDKTSGSSSISAASYDSWIAAVNAAYDNYTNNNGTIFVSAVGDGSATYTTTPSQINPPATAYNSIAVGAYPYSSSATGLGPTNDGRSKPDIVAQAGYTSYSTPIVSGAAAAMVQAGTAADGYSNNDGLTQTAYVNAATDPRTVKALLLNGAVKPVGWTNNYTGTNDTYTYLAPVANATTPLDPRYGAGIVNLGNSYVNLLAGRTAAATKAIAQNEGWDFSAITSGTSNTADYIFNLSAGNQAYDLTSTLVWNAQVQQIVSRNSGVTYHETLNNLDLMLYNAAGTLVASSASTVDNVQQIYTLNLMPGTYRLEVLDNGGGASWASKTDSYALAYNFVAVPEPAALLIILSALAAMPLLRRKHRSDSGR